MKYSTNRALNTTQLYFNIDDSIEYVELGQTKNQTMLHPIIDPYKFRLCFIGQKCRQFYHNNFKRSQKSNKTS